MAVYGLHRWLTTPDEPYFVHAHLHDLMAMPILLGWIDLIVDHRSPVARHFTSPAAAALLTLVGIVVWEVLDPLVDAESVADPVDALCYVAGAFAYVTGRSAIMARRATRRRPCA